MGELGETRIVAETLVIDVRVGEVASPLEGDTIAVEGAVYVIQGEPIRDAERLLDDRGASGVRLLAAIQGDLQALLTAQLRDAFFRRPRGAGIAASSH